MQRGLLLCAIVVLCSPAWSRKRQVVPPMPDHFVIGRQTFFDFGPPFDFYDLYVVRPSATGSSVQRISLTPPGALCRSMSRVEVKSAYLPDPPAVLLGSTNPCSISGKELLREIKRCKHCLVFSGANVTMQVPCGDQTRIIRASILDRDMFDPQANTPHETSWTMGLLARLDQSLGRAEVDKSTLFQLTAPDTSSVKGGDPAVMADLKSGNFDYLFVGAPNKPSQLYAQAEAPPPPVPSVTLVSSSLFPPEVYVAPNYPVIAQLAHIEGKITFTIQVDSKGIPGKATLLSGSKFLFSTVNAAVAQWKFAEPSFNQQIRITLNYALNCPAALK